MGLSIISATQPLQAQALRYCQVAATVLVLYDHAINMEREVDLIWFYHKEKSPFDRRRKRFDLMMMMILVTRYFGEGVLIFSSIVSASTSFTAQVGSQLLDVQGWFTFIAVWTIQAMMQVRVYAMYCSSRARVVLRIMLCCFFVEIASTSILLGLHMSWAPSTFPQTCSPNFSEKDFLTFYIPFLCFESVLLLLVLYAVLQHVLDTRRMCGLWQINPFMKTLTLYSVLYFLVVVTCFAATITIQGYFYVPTAFLLSSLIILSTRSVIAIREPRPRLSFMDVDERWTVSSPQCLRTSTYSPTTEISCIEELESPSCGQLEYP